jgi:Tol biopolymer transport system component
MKALISTGCLLLLAACALRPGPTGDLARTDAPLLASAVFRPQGDPNGGMSPAWSPDGTKIAFLSSTPHTPADLWVMNADGAEATRLTTRGIRGFRWSSDGAALWATGRRKGVDEVFRVDPAGGIEKAPGLPLNASLPVYSPDGELFAVTVPAENRVRDLWIGTADGERLEAVTEKIGVRSLFWSPDSRKVYYEAGESYGVGIWEFDLATMESRVLVNKYIGTPVYSPQSGRIAYPYPLSPGEFEVHVMTLDGSDTQTYPAPRLDGRWLAWDPAGGGVYYLGQDIVAKTAEDKKDAPSEGEKPSALHDSSAAPDFERVGVISLWRLDLASGKERRVSSESLHLADFSLSPDGKTAIISGALEESVAAELFLLDLVTGEPVKLATSRPSFWMPVPSRDSSSIAFFTNEPGSGTLLVVDARGEVQAAYPGLPLARDTRLFRLPESEALVLLSGRGLFAFTEDGPVEFPSRKDHRAFLYTDISVQSDKVLLSAVPSFGETPGLFMLEAVDGKFVQTDLRFPPAEEIVPEVYLQPKWSFDGQKIAFSDMVDIWTMKAEGVGRAWITNHADSNREKTGPPATASHPIWSVSGDKICYTLTVYEGETVSRQLWLVNADGSEPKMLYSEVVDSEFQLYLPEFTNQPFFDIQDARVIFTAVEEGLPNLFAIEIESGRLERLTETGAIFPALLPEEDLILYTSLEGNTERLWVMNSHGTQKRPFEIKARPAEPAAAAAGAEKAAEVVAKEEIPAEAAPAVPMGK